MYSLESVLASKHLEDRNNALVLVLKYCLHDWYYHGNLSTLLPR